MEDCPNVNNVGRINAHVDENQNKILYCVRYGVGAFDINSRNDGKSILMNKKGFTL